MSSYYFGVDEFDAIINLKQSNVPVKVCESFISVVLGFQLSLFRKIDGTWLARGFEAPSPVVIFPPELSICQAKLCKSVVFGLSVATSTLYRVDLNTATAGDNSKNDFSISTVELELEKDSSDESPKLLQIESNDDSVFAMDDQSGVYQVPKLLFRLNNIMKIVKIACGFDHFIILTDTGALYSWGNGSRGQLGFPDIEIKCDVPRRIEFFDDLPCTVKDIVTGGWHSLALTSDGDIYSWGWNQAAQCGHSSEQLSTVIREPYPVDLGSGDNPVSKIGAGARHSVAILKNGEVFSWGWNKYGQLGHGDNSDKSAPTRVHFPNSNEIHYSVSCGRWGTLVQCCSTPNSQAQTFSK